MIKLKPTNKCEVIVEPRYAGNYSVFRIGGCQRTPREEYNLCEGIKVDIKRHVDDVERVYTKQEYLYEVDGEEFETFYEALEYKYEPEDIEKSILPTYSYRYKRPNDDCGSCSSTNDFKKLIEEAYRNPWEFTVNNAEQILTKEQQKFLQNVINVGLEVNGRIEYIEN
jgi:hypothetical protein